MSNGTKPGTYAHRFGLLLNAIASEFDVRLFSCVVAKLHGNKSPEAGDGVSVLCVVMVDDGRPFEFATKYGNELIDDIEQLEFDDEGGSAGFIRSEIRGAIRSRLLNSKHDKAIAGAISVHP